MERHRITFACYFGNLTSLPNLLNPFYFAKRPNLKCPKWGLKQVIAPVSLVLYSLPKIEPGPFISGQAKSCLLFYVN